MSTNPIVAFVILGQVTQCNTFFFNPQEDHLGQVPVAEQDQTLPITTCTVEDTSARPCLPSMVTASAHRSVRCPETSGISSDTEWSYCDGGKV